MLSAVVVTPSRAPLRALLRASCSFFLAAHLPCRSPSALSSRLFFSTLSFLFFPVSRHSRHVRFVRRRLFRIITLPGARTARFGLCCDCWISGKTRCSRSRSQLQWKIGFSGILHKAMYFGYFFSECPVQFHFLRSFNDCFSINLSLFRFAYVPRIFRTFEFRELRVN